MSKDTREALDLLAYMKIYAPDFPAEDETSTAKEFARLLKLLTKIHARTKDAQRKWWLELSIRESEQALAAFESGNDGEGLRFVDSVEDYLMNAKKGRKRKATFIAGPNGIEEKK